MQDNTNFTSTTPKSQDANSQNDEIFKVKVVPTTGDSKDELNDEELTDISGGAACGAGTCSPDMKKRTIKSKTQQ